jgi:hypothetical protein
MRFRGGVMALCVLTALRGPTAAAEETLSPRHQAAVLSSVVAYDRNLHRGQEQSIVIAILYKKTSAVSIAAASEMGGAFNAVARERIRSTKVDITEVGFKDSAELEPLLRAAKVYAIYVTEGLESELPAIQAAAAKLKVTTLCSSREWVRRFFSVGVVASRGKATLVINLGHSRLEGMDLNSAVLNLAEVIR